MKRAAICWTALVSMLACPAKETKVESEVELVTDAKPKVEVEVETDAKAKTIQRAPTDPAALAKARKLYLARLNEGRRLTKAGEYTEATAAYVLALEVDPNDAALLGELGWAAFKGGDLPGARHATTSALRFARTDKQRGMLSYNLGRVAEAESDPTRAAGLYRESLAFRANATVRKRLDALHVAAPAPTVRVGLSVIAEGVQSVDKVCLVAIDAFREEWSIYEDDECSCASKLLLADSGPWAGLLVVYAGMAEELYVPVIQTSAGYTVLDVIVDSYNPGVAGVQGDVEITESAIVADLLGPGKPGWHIGFSKSRVDRDMGLNEIEGESWTGHVFCAREGNKVRCTQPLINDYSYLREVDFPGEDEPGMTHEGLPSSSSYADIASWSAGTLTIEADERKGMKTLDDVVVLGEALSPGEHSLRALMGL